MTRHNTTDKKAKARRLKAEKPEHRAAPAASSRRPSLDTDFQVQLEQKTRELAEARKLLAEALEQQTATSEVLKVISSSPGELERVFDSILQNATRLCEASFGNLLVYEGGFFRRVALHNAPQSWVEEQRRDPTVPRGAPVYRVVQTKQLIHIADAAVEYAEKSIVRIAGARTLLIVPMFKDGALAGAIGIYRQEVRPFTDRQIELVQNFAAQAVIAIENTRLLSELRQRTDDLSESLEQQTATSEVLSVISSSPGALEPVFDAMLGNAARICRAKFGVLWLTEGEGYRPAAIHDLPPALTVERQRDRVMKPVPDDPLALVAATKQLVHISDARAAAAYQKGFGPFVALVDKGGARTLLVVPLLKEGELLGAFAIFRQEVLPFSDKQIELVQSFAAQAVIAIENTRLLNELRQRTDDLTEALEQQTATSEVLKIISSSPGNLQPVFEAMLQNAIRICGAKFGLLFDYNEQGMLPVAWSDLPAAFEEHLRQRGRRMPQPGSDLDLLITSKRLVHTADMLASHALIPPAVLGGARTELQVPMLKDNELVGAISIYRQQVQPFADRQIELLQNFAAQAVIAIENTRLLSDLRESLDQQTATSEVLKVISSSPGELQPVFEAMLENAVRICDAKFGTLFRFDGTAFRFASGVGTPPALVEWQKQHGGIVPQAGGKLDRVMRTRQAAHTADDAAEPVPGKPAQLGGARSAVIVPMLKDDELIGVISIYRTEVRPFTDKQIELVQNFAAQAVIAIENTRLLNELRQRTGDLTEALEQQTATSEVLKVISGSPGELEPVFKAMLDNATRICGAGFGVLFRMEGEEVEPGALHNVPPELERYVVGRGRAKMRPGSTMERAMRMHNVVHVVDVREDIDAPNNPAAKYAGARTLLTVPMFKEDELLGFFNIYRTEVCPFTDRQIELLQSFAAQAVIAIENTRLLSDLRESLDQQTATSEVLKVISSSPGDLKPVFQTVLESATHICDAKFGNLFLCEDGGFRAVAMHNAPPDYAQLRSSSLIRPPPDVGLGRMARTKQVTHVADLMAEASYIKRHPMAVAGVELGGIRTLLAVPMLKEGELIGAIVIYRQEVRPFTDKQIELVQNFAAQAVIAIENTRLLNELRESLDRQTATSEVLQVISSSPGELGPVFNAMLENAIRICGATFGHLALREEEVFRAVAVHGPPEFVEERRQNPMLRPGPGTAFTRIIETRQTVQIPDAQAEPAYRRDPSRAMFLQLAGVRTFICVPMIKDSEVVGVIVMYRQEIRPFSDKQIELVQNFAAQAVIAIENTRLLNELRQRTDDLTESLEQQTATSEVLKVISTSPGDLKPVFQAMLENATRICEAKFGNLFLREGDAYRIVAVAGEHEYAERRRAEPMVVLRDNPGVPLDTLTSTKAVVHIYDISAERPYIEGNRRMRDLVEVAGARTLLAVPMLRERELIGSIVIYRQEVRPFTDKQIDLVSNFAAQAVIAIENTRLLNELRESLQQQTATADVLKVISRSTFDLQAVLNALVESATHLCGADKAAISRPMGDTFEHLASYGYTTAHNEYMRTHPIPANRGSVSGRVLQEGKVIHIPDVTKDQEYTLADKYSFNVRTLLGVPLMREGAAVGVIILQRETVRPFTDKQIELATTFADQAGIAIENVRLFESVEARTRELAQSLEDLQTAQDRLVQTQKLASLGQLTAGIAHEIKNPLNFVNNFSSLSTEMLGELQEALQRGQFDPKTRAEIDDLTDTLRANLEKIEQHGKRADSIVKNMLLHSREGSGEHRPVDINAVVEESLNLAYHGARAEKQGFNITLERSFDPAAGEIDVFPQEITRVLLNLISNGFYAATKRKGEMDDDGYEPTLAVATKDLGDRVEIRIRDNGTGIPPEVKDKMFNPFFTTKPAGEGTGLGLSLSHDIIVKQHAGTIEVDTEPGEFTEIRIILPRAAATIAKSGDGREPSHSRG